MHFTGSYLFLPPFFNPDKTIRSNDLPMGYVPINASDFILNVQDDIFTNGESNES